MSWRGARGPGWGRARHGIRANRTKNERRIAHTTFAENLITLANMCRICAKNMCRIMRAHTPHPAPHRAQIPAPAVSGTAHGLALAPARPKAFRAGPQFRKVQTPCAAVRQGGTSIERWGPGPDPASVHRIEEGHGGIVEVPAALIQELPGPGL